MASSRSFLYGLILGALFFFSQISAYSAAYCSSLNTAQTPTNTSIFQSNGLCYGFCVDNWAFAILQASNCWCSNEAPASTTSTSDCNLPCSGYPDDLCGSSNGLFGYFALQKSPTATGDGNGVVQSSAGRTPSMKTSTTPPFNTPNPSTQTTSSQSSTSTWTPTPVTSLETVTGEVRTVTVTPTIPPNSQSVNAASKKSHGGGISTGGAVGLTIGLVALIALVCSIIYFCIRRRRIESIQKEAEAYTEGSRGSSAGVGGPIPSRTMSENSRYILGTDGRQVVETWEPESRDAPGSRKSRLMPVDPRLDPFAPVYQRGENKSRESVNTMRDDHDYSRRVHQQAPILRATNPDE